MNRSPSVTPPAGGVGWRLGGVDPPQEERGAEERHRVRDDRERRGKQLGEQPAEGRPDDERHRPAAVDERLPVHVLLGRDDRHEQRGVGHVEEDGERAGGEHDGEELPEREHAERVADGDGREERAPPEVAGDHQLPPTSAAVGPGPGVHPEQQAGQPFQGRQVAHDGRARVQREHRGQRHRDRRDLVPDHGHGGRAPVPAEHRVPQQRRHEPP